MKGKSKYGANLKLAFDVGHSSIGWAVLGETGEADKQVELLGCGTVIVRADDCLASSRRAYRRQRRHIRSTRQRIERMKRLLAHAGAMTREQLDKPGCAWPWKLAAQVLSGKSGGNENLLLTWPELWDVLRWYAHNRGYDGNRRWSGGEAEDEEDTEKVENANALMAKFGMQTMAETVCAVSGIDPLGEKRSCNVNPSDRFKGRNAAFPREVVEKEAGRVLAAHAGRLRGLTGEAMKALLEDASAVQCPEIRLPKRYEGGLLFGQLVPRFDNRIISRCPVTGEKVPNRKSREFLDFRWGMQLANVKVGKGMERLRTLSPEERAELDRRIRLEGRFTAKQFMDAVRDVTGCERDNLETMMLHPDAAEALVVDPVQQLVRKGVWERLFPRTCPQVQKRARGRLWHGKRVSLGELREWEVAASGNAAEFDAELGKILEAENTRKRKKDKPINKEELLSERRALPRMIGRAPYSRRLMAQAFREVLSTNRHPKEEGGCLYITEAMTKKELNRRTEEQTNNHLIRHRLLILERLLGDVVKVYAGGDKERVRQVTIEVNRDLREMSGKTAKEIQQDLGQRLANHSQVVKKLEAALGEGSARITAGLIRKARIAEDLGWRCPYTGKLFDVLQLVHEDVDGDIFSAPFLESRQSTNSLTVLELFIFSAPFLESRQSRRIKADAATAIFSAPFLESRQSTSDGVVCATLIFSAPFLESRQSCQSGRASNGRIFSAPFLESRQSA